MQSSSEECVVVDCNALYFEEVPTFGQKHI
jgi:hypothetical protein